MLFVDNLPLLKFRLCYHLDKPGQIRTYGGEPHQLPR